MNDFNHIQCQLKLKLRPAQERQLVRWLFHLTGVWNWAIRKLDADAREGVFYSKYDFKALLKGHSWRMGIPAYVLDGTAAQAYTAWQRHVNGLGGRPRLKGRRNRMNSIPSSHGPRSGQNVAFPGLRNLKYHNQAIPEGRIGATRIVRRASGWYLVLFIQAAPKPIPAVAAGEVGIDPGFSSLLTTSAGEVIDHPRELQTGANRLAQAQRGRRGRLTARLHERVANRRKDRNHKLSRRLVAENQLIAWSKDSVRGLAHTFGKSVSSASHSQLRSMLSYKCRAGGREFIEVASRNSTRTCSACRAITGPTGYAGLKVRQWTCGHCGSVHDRDVNAAINTLAGAGAALERAREGAPGIGTVSHTPKFMRRRSRQHEADLLDLRALLERRHVGGKAAALPHLSEGAAMSATPREALRAKLHTLFHEFQGTTCRTDGGWCDARLHADAALALLASDASPQPQERIDNGNPFIFCDYVSDRRGCVRGAGHNGLHALCLPPYPQAPVRLSRADASPQASAPPPEEPTK